MATNYKINYRVSATPIEEPTLADGSDVARVINSYVDKIIGGGNELNHGTTNTNVGYKSFTTTTSGVAVADMSLSPGSPTNIAIAIVAITAAASSGTPDVSISLDGINYELYLQGVGDALCVRLQTVTNLEFLVKSSGATTTAVIDILVGGS